MSNLDMKKFIYVFSEADKDVMIEHGYDLICIVPKNGIYVFLSENKCQRNFSMMPAVEHCFSDTLTF